MGVYEARVISQQKLQESAYLLELHCPEIVEKAQAGQFVHLKCSETLAPLLRRPFSIHKTDAARGSLSIYYAVVGEGTYLLSKVPINEQLSVLGPLGKGFQLTKGKNVVVIGGGMGIAPMLFLAEELSKKDNKITILLGARDKEGLLVKDSFARFTNDLQLATDDGSLGHKGTVVELLKESLQDNPTMLYACGPLPMLKEVKRLSEKEGIPCQLSLEARMACGIGACLGCTCKGKGEKYYPKVCSDGPVFWAEEVDLSE
ncbi:MAG: dihydroorotate dehydrogenase electron transfer subunit [Clostridia bacterium]|nr:dihydroorotate dehydrogenase electron transfer subunit [Clostridia bacterium]